MKAAAAYQWRTENGEAIAAREHPPRPVGSYCPLDHRDRTEANAPRVPIRDTFALTREELAVCVAIGQERNRKNLERGSVNLRYAGRDDTAVSVQGVIGEYAFARLFKTTVDIYDTTCRNASNDTFDATLDGLKIDVKTTFYEGADLRVTPSKAGNRPFAYALMIWQNAPYDLKTRVIDADLEPLPVLSFRGFVKSDVVFKEDRVRTLADKANHEAAKFFVVPQRDLRAWQEVVSETTGAK